MAGKRWQRQARQRLERERDEGDQAQASERQDISFMTRERRTERVA